MDLFHIVRLALFLTSRLHEELVDKLSLQGIREKSWSGFLKAVLPKCFQQHCSARPTSLLEFFLKVDHFKAHNYVTIMACVKILQSEYYFMEIHTIVRGCVSQ